MKYVSTMILGLIKLAREKTATCLSLIPAIMSNKSFRHFRIHMDAQLGKKLYVLHSYSGTFLGFFPS